MPRRSPHRLRAEAPGPRSGGSISTLLVGLCPGPPLCTAVHTYLFVDGLDVVARSHNGAVGLHPRQLLRPGGPLYPTDAARHVRVASRDLSGSGADGLDIRLGLQGETVVWSDLMYPGLDDRVVVEARFHVEQYVGEIERALAEHEGTGTPLEPVEQARAIFAIRRAKGA